MEKASGDQKWARSSQDDVINATHSSEPLAHCLTHSEVSHMTGQLTDTGENCWLEGNERGIRQDLDLIQDRKDHVGPGLDREIDKYKFTLNHSAIPEKYSSFALSFDSILIYF